MAKPIIDYDADSFIAKIESMTPRDLNRWINKTKSVHETEILEDPENPEIVKKADLQKPDIIGPVVVVFCFILVFFLVSLAVVVSAT